MSPLLPRIRRRSRGPAFNAAVLRADSILHGPPAQAERPDILWMGGGRNAEVVGLARSPDGQWLASASNDQTVKPRCAPTAGAPRPRTRS